MMDAETMDRYFDEHQVDGELPQEEIAKLMSIALSGGSDTMTTAEDESVPEETAEAPKAEQPPEPEQNREPDMTMKRDAERPAIVAKDGYNTIPYSELADAREAAQNERSHREALEREVAALRAKYEGGDKNETEIDEETDDDTEDEQAPIDKLRDDWPEVAEAMDGVFAKQQARIKDLEAVIAQLTPTTEQIEAERQMREHFGRIESAHPDAEAIIASQAFADWRAAQPKFIQQIFGAVLDRGSAEQVIELFDGFKSSTGWESNRSVLAVDNSYRGKDDNMARQTVVEQARQQVKTTTPKSLSDIPGGAAVPTDPIETFMQMGQGAKMDKMLDMSPDKIEEMLGRAV